MADETDNAGQLICREEPACYIYAMTEGTNDILRRVEHWPQEDQDELADVAREIEARRTGVYVLSDDEKAALDEARRSPLASDEEVADLWKRLGIG
jgi:hypothetical protein